MTVLFEDLDTEARITSIPLPHALVGMAPDERCQKRSQGKQQRQVDAGQCALDILPEPHQITF